MAANIEAQRDAGRDVRGLADEVTRARRALVDFTKAAARAQVSVQEFAPAYINAFGRLAAAVRGLAPAVLPEEQERHLFVSGLPLNIQQKVISTMLRNGEPVYGGPTGRGFVGKTSSMMDVLIAMAREAPFAAAVAVAPNNIFQLNNGAIPAPPRRDGAALRAARQRRDDLQYAKRLQAFARDRASNMRQLAELRQKMQANQAVQQNYQFAHDQILHLTALAEQRLALDLAKMDVDEDAPAPLAPQPPAPQPAPAIDQQIALRQQVRIQMTRQQQQLARQKQMHQAHAAQVAAARGPSRQQHRDRGPFEQLLAAVANAGREEAAPNAVPQNLNAVPAHVRRSFQREGAPSPPPMDRGDVPPAYEEIVRADALAGGPQPIQAGPGPRAQEAAARRQHVQAANVGDGDRLPSYWELQ
ncbi:hypothetical protein RQP46_010722 [Phenoliferia psychrophenolica]